MTCRLSNLSLLAEWLNGSLPSRAKPANRAAQRRAPGVDGITVSQGYQFSTRRPVSASSTAAEFLPSARDALSRHAKRPTSATIPGSIAVATRSGLATAASRSAWTRHLPILLARPRRPSACSMSCLTSRRGWAALGACDEFRGFALRPETCIRRPCSDQIADTAAAVQSNSAQTTAEESCWRSRAAKAGSGPVDTLAGRWSA